MSKSNRGWSRMWLVKDTGETLVDLNEAQGRIRELANADIRVVDKDDLHKAEVSGPPFIPMDDTLDRLAEKRINKDRMERVFGRTNQVLDDLSYRQVSYLCDKRSELQALADRLIADRGRLRAELFRLEERCGKLLDELSSVTKGRDAAVLAATRRLTEIGRLEEMVKQETERREEIEVELENAHASHKSTLNELNQSKDDAKHVREQLRKVEVELRGMETLLGVEREDGFYGAVDWRARAQAKAREVNSLNADKRQLKFRIKELEQEIKAEVRCKHQNFDALREAQRATKMVLDNIMHELKRSGHEVSDACAELGIDKYGEKVRDAVAEVVTCLLHARIEAKELALDLATKEQADAADHIVDKLVEAEKRARGRKGATAKKSRKGVSRDGEAPEA